MIDLPLSPDGEAIVTLLVVVGMFVMFVRERYPTEVVALSGAALLLVLGLLPYDLGLAALTKPVFALARWMMPEEDHVRGFGIVTMAFGLVIAVLGIV